MKPPGSAAVQGSGSGCRGRSVDSPITSPFRADGILSFRPSSGRSVGGQEVTFTGGGACGGSCREVGCTECPRYRPVSGRVVRSRRSAIERIGSVTRLAERETPRNEFCLRLAGLQSAFGGRRLEPALLARDKANIYLVVLLARMTGFPHAARDRRSNPSSAKSPLAASASTAPRGRVCQDKRRRQRPLPAFQMPPSQADPPGWNFRSSTSRLWIACTTRSHRRSPHATGCVVGTVRSVPC